VFDWVQRQAPFNYTPAHTHAFGASGPEAPRLLGRASSLPHGYDHAGALPCGALKFFDVLAFLGQTGMPHAQARVRTTGIEFGMAVAELPVASRLTENFSGKAHKCAKPPRKRVLKVCRYTLTCERFLRFLWAKPPRDWEGNAKPLGRPASTMSLQELSEAYRKPLQRLPEGHSARYVPLDELSLPEEVRQYAWEAHAWMASEGMEIEGSPEEDRLKRGVDVQPDLVDCRGGNLRLAGKLFLNPLPYPASMAYTSWEAMAEYNSLVPVLFKAAGHHTGIWEAHRTAWSETHLGYKAVLNGGSGNLPEEWRARRFSSRSPFRDDPKFVAQVNQNLTLSTGTLVGAGFWHKGPWKLGFGQGRLYWKPGHVNKVVRKIMENFGLPQYEKRISSLPMSVEDPAAYLAHGWAEDPFRRDATGKAAKAYHYLKDGCVSLSQRPSCKGHREKLPAVHPIVYALLFGHSSRKQEVLTYLLLPTEEGHRALGLPPSDYYDFSCIGALYKASLGWAGEVEEGEVRWVEQQ